MGARLARKKPRSILTAIIYHFTRLLPNNRVKFRILLDLEWILERLCGEMASARYGADHVIWKKTSMQFVSRHIKPDDAVLDLGCGFGTISHNLALIAGKVVGVDRNPVAISSARMRYVRDNLRFVEDDALGYLDTSGEKFDVLVLTHVLEHIDNPKEFLASYAGRFRRMFIEVPDFDRTYLNHFRQDLNLPQVYTDADHVSEFDRDEFIAMMTELDLRVLDTEYRYGVQQYWIGCD